MQDRYTEAIRFAERVRGRADALSAAATSIAAAARERMITSDEIHQLLEVIADDLKRTADQLLDELTRPAAAAN
ncbi:hypothetical protein [Dyella sp. S184]|uniref:hypothetical protein n=1 Tax=Dyella sp. S184 TaxID=1641862 RepID=UPI00131C6F57|nr:hypothetical protein [Dyella sp. S184]